MRYASLSGNACYCICINTVGKRVTVSLSVWLPKVKPTFEDARKTPTCYNASYRYCTMHHIFQFVSLSTIEILNIPIQVIFKNI